MSNDNNLNAQTRLLDFLASIEADHLTHFSLVTATLTLNSGVFVRLYENYTPADYQQFLKDLQGVDCTSVQAGELIFDNGDVANWLYLTTDTADKVLTGYWQLIKKRKFAKI